MTRIGPISFLATLSLLLPAGFRPLGAGAPGDPAEARPPAELLAVGEANVEVRLDRAAIPAGDSVRVTLVASAETRREVGVRIAVLEQRGSEMARMVPPPVEIAHETLSLVATAGGGPARALAFPLPGVEVPDGADPIAYAGRATRYTVVVRPVTDEHAGAVALPVLAERPTAYTLGIELPADRAPGAPFEAVVRVRSAAARPLTDLTVNLGAVRGAETPGLLAEYQAAAPIEIAPAEGGDGRIASLAPGEERAIRFRVTPGAGAGDAILRAAGWASYGGSARAERALSAKAAPAPTAVGIAARAARATASRLAEPPPPAIATR